jgi:hypothetical protein
MGRANARLELGSSGGSRLGERVLTIANFLVLYHVSKENEIQEKPVSA